MNLKLIGSKITKVSAERNPDFSGKLALDTNINIASIGDYESETSTIKSIKIDAALKVDYHELGNVEVKGQLYLTGDEDTLKTIKSSFSEKNFNAPEMVSIMNVVMQKFSIKAFSLEEELGLPIHVKLPSLQNKK